MDLQLDYTHLPRAVASLDFDRLLRLFDRYQAFIGHDLPNRLIAVQAYARMLQQQCAPAALGEEGLALLTRLADLALQADTRSRQLAEIGRILRQTESDHLLPLDEVCSLALAAVKASGGFAGVTLSRVPCSGTVRAPNGLLHRVLVELLRNAATAARQAEESHVEFEAGQEGGGVVFTIRDNGPGLMAIPPALQPLGCEGESAIQGPPGVGLLLVHQAVAAWRGRLSFRSAPLQGCTVMLFLPDVAEVAPTTPRANVAPEMGG